MRAYIYTSVNVLRSPTFLSRNAPSCACSCLYAYILPLVSLFPPLSTRSHPNLCSYIYPPILRLSLFAPIHVFFPLYIPHLFLFVLIYVHKYLPLPSLLPLPKCLFYTCPHSHVHMLPSSFRTSFYLFGILVLRVFMSIRLCTPFPSLASPSSHHPTINLDSVQHTTK